MVWTSLLLSMLIGSGCTSTPPREIKVGTNIWVGYEPLYLARELGYYKPNTVSLVEYSSASEVMRGFRNGVVDIAALTLDEVIQLAQTVDDLRVILVCDFSNGSDVILARPPIDDLRQLKGKRIAIETTALGGFMLARSLETVGLTATDVQIVSLEITEHYRAYTQERVDAVITFDPVKTQLLKEGAVRLFDSRQIPGEIVDVMVTRTGFIENNETAVRQLVDHWFEALDHMKRNKEDAARRLSPREKITPEEFLSIQRELHQPDRRENIELFRSGGAALQRTTANLFRVMSANGLITRIPDTDRLFDGRFLNDDTP